MQPGATRGWGHPGNDSYRDRVVAIDGVQKQSVAVTAYAVLIGAAQFVNAFCGIRRGPNAKLVFKPTRGFNEGALEIQIATRNRQGIAKGCPILIDYGLQSDFASGTGTGTGVGISGPVAAQQRALLPDVAGENDAKMAEEVSAEAGKKEAAAAEERKRKLEAEAREEEAKRRKAEEAEAQKKKAEAEAARAAGVRGDAQQDGILLQLLVSPPSEFRLVANGSKLALVALESTNKKVQKHCVLAQWTQNVNLTSRTDVGLAWSVQPKDYVLVREANVVIQLQKAMQEHYGTYGQIFQHQEFVAGSCPKALAQTASAKQYRADFSHVSFGSSRAAINKAIELARSAEKCRCIWILRAGESKTWARPCGVAIVSTGQILLQPGQICHL